MTAPSRYPIPAATCRSEETILRSRFITTVAHADTVEGAKAFISEISEEFRDANHNCCAYVIGPPGDTSRVGMSDAGEPHGTAGRPMLNVLLGSGVGDVVAVVTRYFGGTKLGKGGLVRAYSGGVKAALEGLALTELVETTTLRVTMAYSDLSSLKHSLPQFEAQVTNEDYGTDVKLVVVLPEEHEESFKEALAWMTNGKAAVERE
ncbi:MAG: YigZ family protein [Candidatus Eisenbacteria bacterium]